MLLVTLFLIFIILERFEFFLAYLLRALHTMKIMETTTTFVEKQIILEIQGKTSYKV